MKLLDLFDNAEFICNTDVEIQNITYHPEESHSTSLLFLLNDTAIERFNKIKPEAKAIVVESSISKKLKYQKVVVNNIRASLSSAYKRLFCNDLSGIVFVGITGTNGKSTTSIFLKKILEASGKGVGLFGTGKILINDEDLSPSNYSMTTPPPDILYPTIAKMKQKNVDIIIMEVSSHALVQERVFPIEFDIGIFTNLSPEHLDYHKNVKDYFKAKKRLFHQSKKAIINTDDSHGKILKNELVNSYSVGIFEPANSTAKNIKNLGFDGTEFVYEDESGSQVINLNIPATYNVYNALLAIRAAKELGINPKSSKIVLESIEKLYGRFQVLHTNPTVIIDYAHTALAFDDLLKNIYSMKNIRQKLCIVFGCGGERDKFKRPIMGKIATHYADKIIVTSDNPRSENPMEIINDIICDMKTKPIIIANRTEAIEYAIQSADDNDIIAIVGKGPEKYCIHKGIYQAFDEEEIVMRSLAKRPYSKKE